MGEMIPELVAVRMAVTEPDPAAVRYTAAGSVYLSPLPGGGGAGARTLT